VSNKLSALDLAFLALEKQTTPVNVASLAIFQIPKNYKGNFARDLLDKLEVQPAGPPFNQKLSNVSSAKLPSWITDQNFDIHYHVIHSALPKPGKMEDLLELASRLHSRLLDRERPLWEFHLIEGLEGNKFALYMKMHHAAIDGMGGIELMEACFGLSASDDLRAPWVGVNKQQTSLPQHSLSLGEKTTQLTAQVKGRANMVQDLSKIFWQQGLKATGISKNTSPVPFTAPKSIFNVPITGTRRFAIKSMSLSEVKTIGKQANATVNDMVLALCSGALRRYLLEKNALPKKSMIASVPVSVRQVNRTGNQITYVAADLATNEPDSMARLAKIGASTKDAKQEIGAVSSDAATSFAVIAQGLVAVTNQLNMTNLLPPAANVTISNVPGPRQPLYFGQAKMEATYPLSVLIDGQSLNITVVSYCDSIDFGIMACRDIIPDVEKIAEYIDAAMDGIKGGIYMQGLMQDRDNSLPQGS
jgi:diacylglycerol O-acyltransferase